MYKKEEILYATFKLFAKKGYNTSMSDIAKQVGIKVPSIYSHFESKDEIIYLVMTREIGNYFRTLCEEISLFNKEGCEYKLKKICFSVFEYFSEPERIRFWKSISLIPQDELRIKCRNLVREHELEISQKVLKIFEEGSKKGQIKKDFSEGSVLLYLAMIQGVLDAMLMYHDTTIDLKSSIQKIWQAYWEGLKA